MQAVSDLTGALEQIRRASPDAVVLDLNLPDSEGLATLRAVLASAPQLPVVVLTGVADVDIARQALQLGAQDWLVKGQLDPDVVQRAVRYAVERKHLTDRLVQAQKLEIAGRLANGVAHEFNNVLTAIAGSAQLVEDAADAEARAGALDLLRRAARQGIALSRQLLSLARNPPNNAAVVSTAGLVDSGRVLVQAVLPSTIQLEVGPVADVPVRLDPGQFDQLLLNLVLNARDAMPEGARCGSASPPSLRTRRRPGPNGRVRPLCVPSSGSPTPAWASTRPSRLTCSSRFSRRKGRPVPASALQWLRKSWIASGARSTSRAGSGGNHDRGVPAGRVRASRGVTSWKWKRGCPGTPSGRGCSSSTTRSSSAS